MPAAVGRSRHERRQPRLVASRPVGRIARGWYLATVSLRVVRSDGTLSVLVVLGGIASGATALGFLVPAAVAYSIEETWLAGIVAVVGVYLATLVATYFAVALAAASAEVLEDAIEAEARLELRPGICEARAAQDRLEPM